VIVPTQAERPRVIWPRSHPKNAPEAARLVHVLQHHDLRPRPPMRDIHGNAGSFSRLGAFRGADHCRKLPRSSHKPTIAPISGMKSRVSSRFDSDRTSSRVSCSIALAIVGVFPTLQLQEARRTTTAWRVRRSVQKAAHWTPTVIVVPVMIVPLHLIADAAIEGPAAHWSDSRCP